MYYTLNKETGKIELTNLEQEDYQNLESKLKNEIKRYFLFSKVRKAWVSKSTKNHYMAISIAKKLGFTEKVEVGQRLTYEEQLDIKVEKAERRAERYNNYADNADKRGQVLQSEFKKYVKEDNIAFFTQPNIVDSAKGRIFTNYRNRVLRKYEKGFEEYGKARYLRDKAETALETATMGNLQNKVYLATRIDECEKKIKKLSKLLEYEDQDSETRNKRLELLEDNLDKLEFYTNKFDEIGGKYCKKFDE
jgi:hypothetical protein